MEREAGGLRYRLEDGREFRSLSSAGSAVMGGIACNGWRFWSVADGGEVAPPKAGRKSGRRGAKKGLFERLPDQEGLPEGNTWFVEEEIRQHEVQNVCIAIALEEGLIAPAILDCGKKTLAEIAQASRDLGKRAKSGALKSEEYSGGTFTITNLGMFGVEEIIAIIQSPQTAILGVGELRPTPVVREGEVVVAEVMKVALSADHRVSDGAQGAQFLGEIKRLLENPVSLLL